MKFGLLFLVLSGLLVVTCEKNKNNENEIVYEDEIVYTDISPDIEIQSVRFFEQFLSPWGFWYYPNPRDSVINYSLDVDSDYIEDFKIVVSHGYHDPGPDACIHVPSYKYTIMINGVNESSTCVDPDNHYYACQMDSGVVLSSSSKWRVNADLSKNLSCAVLLPYPLSLEDKYIGIKTKNRFGWINVAPMDNNGIKISEYAINLTEGNIIITGQKE